MSIWERRRGNRRDDGRDDPLVVLDDAIPDLDWTVLPLGARAFRFPTPSGSLAALSLGDPAHPRVVLVPGATGARSASAAASIHGSDVEAELHRITLQLGI